MASRLRERIQQVRQAVQSGGASVGVDLVVGAAERVAGIADRFIDNPQEKKAFELEWKRAEMEEERLAMEADAAILADRQSARAMAGVHGKLQHRFAMVFLIAFYVILGLELTFIGLIVVWQTREGAIPIADWLQVLISSTLAGVLGYMASMLKEITGFLFGGSAGGDDREAMLTETLRDAGRGGAS